MSPARCARHLILMCRFCQGVTPMRTRDAVMLGLAIGWLGLVGGCIGSRCHRDAITDPAGQIVGYVEHCDDQDPERRER